jgi:hypothetical protein
MSAEPIADLAHARAAFDEWRAGRPRPGRLPEHLWALAESLVPHHSAQTVATELGLNPGRLRARLSKRTSVRPKTRGPKGTFIELRAADLMPKQEPASRSAPTSQGGGAVTARNERPDGSSLTLSLPPGQRDLLERLCSVFLLGVPARLRR